MFAGLIKAKNAERADLVDVVVTKNANSFNYQLPKKFTVNKVDRDTLSVKIDLNNDKDSLILNYNKFFNDKWVLKSQDIRNQRKFASNIFFNSWIISPQEGKQTIELTLKFKESKYETLFKEVNKYSIIISVVLLVILNIYEYRKIFYKLPIRKFWR
jgi:hypothetical protein